MQSARAATQSLVSHCYSSLRAVAAAAAEVHPRSAAFHMHCCNAAAVHDPDSSAVHADADSDSAEIWPHLEAADVVVCGECCQAGAAGLQRACAETEECQVAIPKLACPGRCQKT